MIPMIPGTCLYTYSYLHALASSVRNRKKWFPEEWCWIYLKLNWTYNRLISSLLLKQRENTGGSRRKNKNRREIIEQQLKVASIRMWSRKVTLPVFPLRNIYTHTHTYIEWYWWLRTHKYVYQSYNILSFHVFSSVITFNHHNIRWRNRNPSVPFLFLLAKQINKSNTTLLICFWYTSFFFPLFR